MSKLNDEQMDRIIKEEFHKDKIISEKASSIFENFNPQTEEKSPIKEEINKTNKNVIDVQFYKKLNKILSVAAVSLTVVLVGGTTLYFNKDKLQNNVNNPNETITYTANNLIKNEPLHFSNEQVIKEIEDNYVKVYLVGNKDVGVEFKSFYWDELLGNVTVASEKYKIDGINGEVKDIFIGKAVNSVVPYIFILMKDSTAMYVDLHGHYGNYINLYYTAVSIDGLDDIVGFEEKTRKFSYSNTDYTYVNAIRSDGKRKEIEIGKVNDWEDTSSETFDKYNEKYINAHEGKAIPDDGKGDFEVDGIQYYTTNRDNKNLYCLKGDFMHHDLYRIERSTGKETCIASGINGMTRNDIGDRIKFYVIDNNFEIYELDDNIIYSHSDGRIITEVTKNNQETKTQNKEGTQQNTEITKENSGLSNFEKKVFESGNYYYNSLGHYCMQNSKDRNSAYHIENNELFRTNIADNDSVSWIATGIEDMYKDENGNLIAIGQPDFIIHDHSEPNITFREYNVTNSPIVETYSNENIEITLKKDGSLTTKILTGGLQRLGFYPGETTITENVLYNTFGSAHGVENKDTHFYYADAKKGILTPAGRNGRLCFVYEKGDGNVIAIDILNAIECGSFTGARTSECYIEGKIEKLYIAEFADDKDAEGNAIPKYKTVFALVKEKNGNERSIHMFMPCEDE